MTEQTKPTGFIAACKEYFGFLPNQNLKDFRDEVARLTPEDRAEMAPLLPQLLGKPVGG
jgi:hypothetical protein